VRALITGAGGFVGPHLVDHLRRQGDVVVPVDVGNGPDLRDHRAWAALVRSERPEVIFHLAGLSDVGASWHDPQATFEVNLMGTVSVLEAARLAGTGRVVVISSAEVYGVVATDELPIVEDHPLVPSSPYGASKQAAEDVARQYHRGHGLETVIARPFNHIGPGQSTRFAAPAFADQIAAAERRGGPATLRHGDLTPERDLTDVRDVVRAYRLLAESGRPGEVYNVCSGRSTSMATVLETLLELTGAAVTTETDPARIRPVEVPVQRGSPARLAATTGWRPTIDLRASLSGVLDDARRRHGVGLRAGTGPIG
jgi:GDP-4-dehydro-6-deoxy-D-mannose reductase